MEILETIYSALPDWGVWAVNGTLAAAIVAGITAAYNAACRLGDEVNDR